MDARHVLARLRDHKTLSQGEITWFANGLATGAVSECAGRCIRDGGVVEWFGRA